MRRGKIFSVILACSLALATRAQDAENLFDAVRAGDVETVEEFIVAGLDVNAKNEKGTTPLIEAAGIPNVALVEMLLAAGAKVDTTDDDGNTALMKAAVTETGFATVALLVKAGADIHAANKRDMSAYDLATEAKASVNILTLIAPDEPTPAERKREQWNAMIEAISQKDMESFHDLLGMGLDPNSKMGNDITLLNVAIVRGNTDMVRALCDAGADVNLKGKSHMEVADLSPLYLAIVYDRVEAVKELLEFGAELDALLGVAVRSRKDMKIAKMLLSAGANPNIVTHGNGVDATPLMIAVLHNDIEFARMLVSAGADLEVADQLNFTALNIAQYHKNEALVQFLKTSGAKEHPVTPPLGYDGSFESQKKLIKDLRARVSSHSRISIDDTPVYHVYKDNGVDLGFRATSRQFMQNATNTKIEDLEFILANGADPNVNTNMNQPILSSYLDLPYAFMLERSKHVECLLKYGANPNIKNNFGNTPFQYLCKKERNYDNLEKEERTKRVQLALHFMKLLIDAGADVKAASNNGYTALHLAIQWHDAELLKPILDAGADPFAKKEDGKTPYDMLIPEDFANFTPEFQRLLDTHFKPTP